MKIKKLLTGMLLASTLTVGVILGIGSNKKAATVKADDDLPAGIYVDISSCQWDSSHWNAGYENIKAYFMGGSVSWPGTNVSEVTVNGTTYGYISVPSTATGVIFNAWGGDTNQNKTEDLSIPTDGKCLFKLNTYNTSSVQKGAWHTVEERYTGVTSASSSTGRVFLNNDGSHQDWKDAQLAVRAWGGSASEANNASHSHVTASTYNVSWFNGEGEDGKWYAYADIPTNVSGYQFVRMSDSTSSATIWSYSDSFELSGASFSSVHYLNATSTDVCPVTQGRADSVGPAFAANIIKARNTCDSSVYNGYGAISDLNTNFFGQCTSEALSSSCRSLGGNADYTVAQHIAQMQRIANGSSAILFFVSKEKTNSVLVIVIVSAALIAAIGGYFFIRRKHEK